MASKELEALEELKKSHYVDGRLPLIDKCRFDIIERALTKHEQNKAIEQELGIDLEKFFMGFKKNVRIYYKKGKKIKEGIMTLGVLSKYGKTWALTEKELKHGKE